MSLKGARESKGQLPSAFFALLPHLIANPTAFAFRYFILGGEKLEFAKLRPTQAPPLPHVVAVSFPLLAFVGLR